MIGTLMRADIFGHLLVYFNMACLLCYVLLLAWGSLRTDLRILRMSWIHIGYILSRILYGIFLSAGQYVHWFDNQFTRPLTYLPLPSGVPLPGLYALFGPLLRLRHGYFFDYMLSHFWLALFWGLLTTLLLYILLRALRAYRPHLLSALDINIFIAGSLIVGWPDILLYVIVAFVLFFIHVVFVTIRGGGRAPLYPSLIIATVLVYFSGTKMEIVFPIFDMLRFTH